MDYFIKEQIQEFLKEDLVSSNSFYSQHLPSHSVRCLLKFKSNGVVAGIHAFIAVFELISKGNIFSKDDLGKLEKLEGKRCNEGDVIEFTLPFNLALTGERIALNLLAHASSVATATSKFVEIAKPHGIKILDTRKTTPGLRWLEKYAVRIGGGFNHRMGQTDVWMIKDNHKKCMGGLNGAFGFFNSMGTFYNPIHAEVHSLSEFEEASKLKIKHIMLDNFSPEMVIDAVSKKTSDQTIEISGGITLENIKKYLIKGVDAISIGAITQPQKCVDISLKMESL